MTDATDPLEKPPDLPGLQDARVEPTLTGRILAGHQVISVLGKGGMGEVYLAKDLQLKRLVALKVLPKALAADDERMERFRREAEALAKIEHPGIVRIYGFHVFEESYFFTMGYVRGRTLDERCGRGFLQGDLNLEEFFDLALQVVDAVEAAHECGVVHRDLKPQNVMVTPEERVRVLDFGLVKLRASATPSWSSEPAALQDAPSDLTRAGAVFGTAAYMAPEQVRGLPADQRTDLYAVGVMLFEMLTEERPFQKDSLLEMFQAILHDPPKMPESDRIPDGLRDIVMRCLEKNPDARFPSAAALGEALQRLRRRERTVRERRRRRRIAAAATSVLVAVLLVLTGWALRNAQRAEEQARHARDLALLAIAGDIDRTSGVLLLDEISRPEELKDFPQRMLDLSRGPIAWRQFEHERSVQQLIFGPRGRTIASVSSDRTLRIWNVDDPANPLILSGHRDVVRSLDLSADGRLAVTGSFDGDARVWDLDKPSDPWILSGHENHVWRVDLSPDEKHVLTGSWDGTARFWTIGDPEKTKIHHADSPVWAARFSPDGSIALLGLENGSLRLWDPVADEVVDLPGHRSVVYSAVFSPDGQSFLAASWDGTASFRRRDRLDDVRVLSGHQDRLWSVGFSPDGKRAVTASWDQTARVWDLEDSSNPPLVLRGHRGGLIQALFSPDGEHVLTISEDQTAHYWNLADPEHPRIFEGRAFGVAALSNDGAWAAIGTHHGKIRLWNIAEARENPRTFYLPQITAATFHPDGAHIATGEFDGTLAVRRADDFSILHAFPGGAPETPGNAPIRSLAFHPDGSRLAAASGNSILLREIVDPASSTKTLSGHQKTIWTVEFSPRGDRLLSAADDGEARIWDLLDAERPPTILPHETAVLSASYAPDGRRIGTTGFNQKVYLWDLSDSEEPRLDRVLDGSGGVTFAARFHPDGTRLVVSSMDGMARLWDLESPSSKPRLLRGHNSGIVGVDFDPSGRFVATAGWDHTAGVWELENPDRPRFLRGHRQRLHSIEFSPDGSRILTVARDGGVRIWIYRTEDLRDDLHDATRVCLSPELRRLHLEETPEQSLRRAEECRLQRR